MNKWLAIIALLLAISTVLLPMLAGWLGVFFDDYYETFSRLRFAAGTVKSGHLPLWDPHAFAGGRLNYIPNTRIWYWPLYPFYLLSPAGDVDGSYFWLIKLPLFLHWLLSGFGAFLLGRRVLDLNPGGALMLGAVFSLGSGMSYNICDPNTTYAVAWIPWALCGIEALARRTSRFVPVLGALAVAFIGPCGSDVRAIFSLATISFLVVLLVLTGLLQRERKYAFRLLCSSLIILGLGILLSAPYWLGMLETAEIYRGSPLLASSWAASDMFSMPWKHLTTILLPDLFATLTCAQQVDLGLGDYLHIEGNLTGGYLLLLVILLGTLSAVRRGVFRAGSERIRLRWWVAGLILVIFSWLMVTGKNSPVYLFLVRMVPPLGLPYALRWRILGHLGIALLAGISAHWLLSGRAPLSRRGGLVLAALTLGIVAAQGLTRLPGGEIAWQAVWSRHRGWLSFSLIPALIVVLAATALVLFWPRKHRIRMVLVGLVVAEMAAQAFQVIYFLEWAEVPEWVKYVAPTRTAYYRITAPPGASRCGAGGVPGERESYHFSLLDQVATLHGGNYLLGHCSKPLLPRWREVVQEVTTGYPYALRLRDHSLRFFPNMSVGSIWLPGGQEPGPLRQFKPDGVLPRLYFQDNVILADPAAARAALIHGDLRTGAYLESEDLDEENRRGFSDLTGSGRPVVPGRFARLQDENRILSFVEKAPTQMETEVDLVRKSILIVTDVYHPDWEVTVDGKPGRLLRVNYLQRAVLLTPGFHRVVWTFRPREVKIGLFIMGLGLVGLIVLAGLVKVGSRTEPVGQPPAG